MLRIQVRKVFTFSSMNYSSIILTRINLIFILFQDLKNFKKFASDLVSNLRQNIIDKRRSRLIPSIINYNKRKFTIKWSRGESYRIKSCGFVSRKSLLKRRAQINGGRKWSVLYFFSLSPFLSRGVFWQRFARKPAKSGEKMLNAWK